MPWLQSPFSFRASAFCSPALFSLRVSVCQYPGFIFQTTSTPEPRPRVRGLITFYIPEPLAKVSFNPPHFPPQSLILPLDHSGHFIFPPLRATTITACYFTSWIWPRTVGLKWPGGRSTLPMLVRWQMHKKRGEREWGIGKVEVNRRHACQSEPLKYLES